MVDLLATAKLNDDEIEEIPQPNRGNKVSKKNKKKNKNLLEDLDDEFAGLFLYLICNFMHFFLLRIYP